MNQYCGCLASGRPSLVEWLGSLVVRASDLQLDGHEFDPLSCTVSDI